MARVRQLIAAGADVNRKDANGKNALVPACFKAHPDVVRLLLDAGANPSGQMSGFKFTGRGASPLIASVTGNCPECADLLLAKGADPLYKDEMGETALGVARRIGNKILASKIEACMKEKRMPLEAGNAPR